MAQATWEKSGAAADQLRRQQHQHEPAQVPRRRFSHSRCRRLSGHFGHNQLALVIFITVDELLDDPVYIGQTVRISGAVVGETIEYDPETLTIEFTMSNIPAEFENLALALHEAVNDPDATRIPVVVNNEVKPDLLQHEAQAILTGELGE